MDHTYVVETKNLVKVYGRGETTVRAVDDVTMQIEPGEFVALVGESGSGKTTLLNLLGALDTPTSGEIIIGGQSLAGQSDAQLSAYRRRNVGFIFQSYNLIPVLNVAENIALPMSLDNQEVDQDYLSELLEILGLTDRRDYYPHQLSGGQQQRVAIGRALIAKPKLLLADEPTGNLDSRNSREIVTLLQNSVRKYNQTLLLITHDGHVAAHADRVLHMLDGRLWDGAEEGV
ncbi:MULTISPECIES: ABC transporter ATP-binding protein [Ruminococcus]|jgi:putative ABC transport system ATP-binding protein|uniref:ABC-type antimicrobial peptide transport system, ATPase component n=1 Tax=Ruminococcus champanellensis (strain DSM 18848 / JCM 17042 / KCTC 15320 / 18P13) TaxID=213810 RepID=D4LEQ5_RUMC1|nr:MULTISPECIES: ABC transporter ATP-binding protein [Ruminococcus]MED9892635.1 ABC transporter ATP-binding protein [Ruminococcus champanellensis]CBL18100.1 ABC-type antimicrobial peptide transport system, ATPase component [Ruminococcus champanellensis 18P13 = JCM 17042]CDD54148.1 aBC-type antimicrobial peptide transport system ATPase component [Ruminococcus sp. CAG:379]